ncbi:MAG: hypothetical protein AAF216_05790 [Pseudomonadota bacterium]
MKYAALVVAAVLAAVPSVAQVEIRSLEMIDPFGRGYLEDGEAAMPTNMWKASRTEDLLPLMRQVRTRQLTPSERTLLRRVVVSPAARPEGERANEVLAERARILYELGEADAAADLLSRLPENPRGLDAAQLAVDLQLALGNEASACASLTSETREGAFWAKLRAVCAVLRNDTEAALLAIELAEAQGVNDDWFKSAVFASTLENTGDLVARFDTGMNLALSTKLALEPPVNSITTSRPDLAAAMAERTTIPIDVRIVAAGVAAEAGLIDGPAHRQLYREMIRQENFQPTRPVEVAIQALDAPGTASAERDRKLAMALRSSMGNAARFAAAARLFEEDLSRIGRNAESARHALTFARAEIATGDFDRADDWLDATGFKDAPEFDPFDVAMMRATMVLIGHERSDETVAATAAALVESAADNMKRAQAARMFALWTARYVAPPAAARSLMAGARPETAPQGNAWRMLAVRAAAEAEAAGEVVVSTLGVTRGDPTRLPTPDLLIILDSLTQIGASDVAEQLTLEATGYWKVSG